MAARITRTLSPSSHGKKTTIFRSVLACCNCNRYFRGNHCDDLQILPQDANLQLHPNAGVCLIPIPIYRSGPNEFDYKLANYLKSNGHWSPNSDQASFQQMACFSPSWRDGHSIFHAEFSWRAEEWIEWTEENRTIAQELWKNVLRNLRLEQPNESIMELMYDAKFSSEADKPALSGEDRG